MSEDLSTKMRLYLAEMYRLAEMQATAEGYITTSALSELLNVTAPAVNRMVNRLKELDLLEHQPYQGIRLTDTGKHEALQQLRRQRIIEVFLVKRMQFRWDEVHSEASQLSLSISAALLERMNAMSAYPAFCPHGEPIPDAAGNLAPLPDQLLSSVAAGKKVRVTRIRTRDPERLRYIEALGLMPHAPLEVLHVAPFNGPMQLKMEREYRIVGHNLAELIRVQEEA
jgi:DtxR family Mn-dependent transcriptional regulator